MITETIISLGFELEGGICSEDLEKLRSRYINRLEIGADPSVRVRKPRNLSCDWIPNVEIRYYSYSLEDLKGFIKFIFTKTSFRQNRTCGNHVHINILSPHYLYLISPEFIFDFRWEYEIYIKGKAKKYAERITNRYCKFPETAFDYEENVYAYGRYFAINFASLINHGTLEIRIMPHARSAREYTRNLIWIVSTIEKLLKKYLYDASDNTKLNIEIETEIDI